MRDEGESYAVQFGAHTIRFEPPDVYMTTFVGPVSEAEMIERNDAIKRFAEGKPWVLGIADLRRGSLTPEARRAAMHLTPLSRGSAFISPGDPRKATSLTMLGAARSAVQLGEIDSPLGFVDTEEEARAWIAGRRSALQNQS